MEMLRTPTQGPLSSHPTPALHQRLRLVCHAALRVLLRPPRQQDHQRPRSAAVYRDPHFSAMNDGKPSAPAPDNHPKQFLPVPRPHCQQITRIVWAIARRRHVRYGAFRYYLRLIIAVGTENCSFPKPVGPSACSAEHSHRLSELFGANHPAAQLLSSVLENYSDLKLTSVVVCHSFLPGPGW